jgi:hypothetical protein
MAHKLARRRAARCACPAPGASIGLLTRGTSGQSVRPGTWRQLQAKTLFLDPACRVLVAASGPSGTVASSSARHGRLRRNAVSPHGVKLGGAPGAPLWIGCSSPNRALAGKLLWDGIVAVPKVFGAGCPVPLSTEKPSAEEPSARGQGQPGGSAHPGDAGEPYSRPDAPRPISLTCGHKACGNKATHGGTQGVAGFMDVRRLSEQRESIPAPRGAAVPGRRA